MNGAKGYKLEMVDHKPGAEADQPDGQTSSPSRRQVWKMFDRIAARYDLLNHLLSANVDKRWRRQVAELLPAGNDLRVLDLATGTGDQLLALYESGRVSSGFGTDLADRMLDRGREKISRLGFDQRLSLEHGNAEAIESESDRFDAVTISFGIRNMSDVSRALAEMHRVLKPGGRALVLEFSVPANRAVRSMYLFYLRHILPGLGRLISGDSAAYRYLNETIETFPHGDTFCRLMTDAGFESVHCTPLSFGIASIYQGDKR
jgi:demethylmenaquinone methyltransferase/2-methoxy-6-polyprenyl-1,4-benzoquinol methylase